MRHWIGPTGVNTCLLFENMNGVQLKMDDLMLVQKRASLFVPSLYPKKKETTNTLNNEEKSKADDYKIR